MPIKSDDGIFLARECPKCRGSGKQTMYTEFAMNMTISTCERCEGKGFYKVCTTVDAFIQYIASRLSTT